MTESMMDAQYANATSVRLTQYEAHMAAMVGFHRQFKAMQDRRKALFAEQYPGQLWYNHIGGACAECAVSKRLGLYWGGGVDTFDATDIDGQDFEVRFSPSGKPKVRERDTRTIIGVCGSAPGITEFQIWGWIRAEDARREEWRSAPSADRPPCWFPPAHAWNHIDTLKVRR